MLKKNKQKKNLSPVSALRQGGQLAVCIIAVTRNTRIYRSHASAEYKVSHYIIKSQN